MIYRIYIKNFVLTEFEKIEIGTASNLSELSEQFPSSLIFDGYKVYRNGYTMSVYETLACQIFVQSKESTMNATYQEKLLASRIIDLALKSDERKS